MIDNHLSNLIDSGMINVKKTKKKERKSRKSKKSSSLKRYKRIKDKKSINKYNSPIIKINKVDDTNNGKIIKENKIKENKIKENKKVFKSPEKKGKSKKIDVSKKTQNKKRIRNKKNVEMIEYLRKKGIYVSGKNPKLLKDIYLYSLDDNIRIINE